MGGGGGGHLFEAGFLLTFSAFWMGAYSRLGAYSNNYGIPSDMCFLGMGTHNIKYVGHYNETLFTMDMCFLGSGTHITRDMCFLGKGNTFHCGHVFSV